MKRTLECLILLAILSCGRAESVTEKATDRVVVRFFDWSFRYCERCVLHETYVDLFGCNDSIKKIDYKFVTNIGIIEGKCVKEEKND